MAIRSDSHLAHRILSRSRGTLGLVLLLVTVAALLTAGGAVAQRVSNRVTPQIVTSPPDFSNAQMVPLHADWTGLSLVELERRLGTTVVAPAWLPDGCNLWTRTFLPDPQVASLQYDCVTISMQAGTTQAMPPIPASALQVVDVNGVPAAYIDGTWSAPVNADGTFAQSPARWVPGQQQQLFLERGDLVIWLTSAGSWRPSLTQDQLITIAASLR